MILSLSTLLTPQTHTHTTHSPSVLGLHSRRMCLICHDGIEISKPSEKALPDFANSAIFDKNPVWGKRLGKYDMYFGRGEVVRFQSSVGERGWLDPKPNIIPYSWFASLRTSFVLPSLHFVLPVTCLGEPSRQRHVVSHIRVPRTVLSKNRKLAYARCWSILLHRPRVIFFRLGVLCFRPFWFIFLIKGSIPKSASDLRGRVIIWKVTFNMAIGKYWIAL